MTDGQVQALLETHIAAEGQRIPADRAAKSLGIAVARLRGAIPLLQRLLNYEGYQVLRTDADGSTVILDVALLREQFPVSLR